MPGFEVKEHFIFYRIRDPGRYHLCKWKWLSESQGIAMIYCELKDRSKWENQALRFDRKKWTLPEARKWVSEHKERLSEEIVVGANDEILTDYEMRLLEANPTIAGFSDDYFAIPLRRESEFVPGTSKCINLRQLDGVKARIGQLDEDKDKTGIEYVLFEAQRHDEKSAEAWVQENEDRDIVDIIYRDFQADPKKAPLIKWPDVVVCRTGKWIVSNGSELKITKKMLGEMARNYDPSYDEAPVVANHEDTQEAKGWVERLRVLGDYLVARLKDVSEGFKEKIKAGAWKKRSIRIHYGGEDYTDAHLVHVAFLGAIPPAVKGMPDVEFAAQLSAGADPKHDSDLYFEIDNLNNLTPITLKAEPEPVKDKIASQDQAGGRIMGDKSEDLKKLEQEKLDLEAKLKALETEKSAETQRADAAEKSVKDVEQKRKRAELESYLEEQIREGRLIPAVKEDGKVVSMMEALSEGEGDHLKTFKGFIESTIPKGAAVKFGELAKDDGKKKTAETAFTRQVKESVEAGAEEKGCPIKDLDKVGTLEAKAKKLQQEDSNLSKAEAFRQALVEMNKAGEVNV